MRSLTNPPAIAGNYRDKVKAHILDPRQRRLFWEQTFQGSIAELIFAGQHEKAENALNKQIIAHNTTTTDGEIYLVGAGPGDPDLLTLKALDLGWSQCHDKSHSRVQMPDHIFYYLPKDPCHSLQKFDCLIQVLQHLPSSLMIFSY